MRYEVDDEELIYDLLLDRFPWLVDLFDDPHKPIEEVIQFVGGLAYNYGYEKATNDFKNTAKKRKTDLYDIKKEVKKYEN